jgi:hypothetical protein
MSKATVSASLAIGSGGATIKAIKTGTLAVTVTALADGAEEEYDLTVTGAAAGDIIIVHPTDAAAETGLAIIGAWVAGANTVTVRVSNVKGSGLTGSTASWPYLWFDLT